MSPLSDSPAMDKSNPYQILGIPMAASEDDIKRAYFTCVRQFPPEKYPREFKDIQAAYERLRKPSKRMETDFSLFRPAPTLDETFWHQPPDLAVHPEDLLQLAFELTLSPLPKSFSQKDTP